MMVMQDRYTTGSSSNDTHLILILVLYLISQCTGRQTPHTGGGLLERKEEAAAAVAAVAAGRQRKR